MLELIKAEGERLETIAELAKKIWNLHYPPIIGQAQVDYMLERFYNHDSLIKQQLEGQDFYLIAEGQKQLGFISISRKSMGNYFIHKFYIDTNEQGKGIGEEIFEKIKELIENNQVLTTIQLTVNRQNFKAINFYFKLGFKIKQIADFDIENGYQMNDFVMEWNKTK